MNNPKSKLGFFFFFLIFLLLFHLFQNFAILFSRKLLVHEFPMQVGWTSPTIPSHYCLTSELMYSRTSSCNQGNMYSTRTSSSKQGSWEILNYAPLMIESVQGSKVIFAQNNQFKVGFSTSTSMKLSEL